MRANSVPIPVSSNSMVLKLYGPQNVAGGNGIVALLLAEKRIPFEFVQVDMASKQHKSQEFVAMQPFGQVPVIDDNGFILYESRAICRYLEEKYPNQGTKLVPTGLKARALFEQAASVEFANFHPAVMKVAMEAVWKRRQGSPIDQAVVDKALDDLSAKLDVYESILGKQKYMAGDELTLVDLFHLFYAPMLAGADIDVMTKESRPNVARWWKEIISRPAWVKLKEHGIKGTVN
ncbi:glutathione S-transferase [Mycena pura]|uniref:glutathione transferase n=1 Tax=Mycena pura TaxID=153505 RepID=A0AAD6UUM0_9AGAR|nr:glutathione S-transferase [Mycena pura]